MVVAELGQRPSLVVHEQVHFAAGADHRDRLQGLAAGVHDQERPQGLRHRLGRSGERLVDLEACCPHGQLEVPAGIRSSGTTAQADPCRGQRKISGVEVRRLELVCVPALHRVDAGKLFERRQVRVGVDGVGVLDLVLVSCQGSRSLPSADERPGYGAMRPPRRIRHCLTTSGISVGRQRCRIGLTAALSGGRQR